jgi:hypothetical protein
LAHYQAGVIAGEATRRQLGGWPCRELDRVAVRGRTARVTIHEPLAEGTPGVTVEAAMGDAA